MQEPIGQSAADQNVVAHAPAGYPPKVSAQSMAPRLESLEGRTLVLLDCRFDNSKEFLEQVRHWFDDKMPYVRIEVIQMAESWVEDRHALDQVRERGDAALAGVGL
jgi:hypothetical protein